MPVHASRRRAAQAVAWSILLGVITALFIGALPAAAAAPNSTYLRAEYDVDATIHWSRGTINVVSTVHVTNTSSDAITGLTFNLIPLEIGRARQIETTIGGTPVVPTISGMSLILDFSGPLAPKLSTDVVISYKATFNTKTGGKKSLFMKKNNTVAAYRWIPWLSKKQRFGTPNFGESWVTGVSPRVRVTIRSDTQVDFATSGVRTDVSNGGLVQTFVANDVRDFNFAASPNYRVETANWNGIQIRVLYRKYSPNALLKWTTRALKYMTDRVGAYPYNHLDVAETPAGVGMESPGMTWVDGTIASSRFAYITTHEAMHQWFYAVVGNNQGTNPFLDEGTVDFFTRDLLNSFRKSFCSKKALDKTVWDYSARCYPEVVYVQGGLYLRDYRAAVGAAKFWAGMRNFYVDFKFRIANTRDLLDALDAASGFNSQQHENRFPGLY